MQISFAAGAGKKLRFDRERVQKVIHTLGGFIRIKTGAQRGILRRHANWASPGVAMIAISRFCTDFFWIIGFRNILVAIQGHHRGMPDGNRIRAQRNGFRNISAVSDATCINQADFTALAKIVDGFARLTYRGHSRHPGVFGC